MNHVINQEEMGPLPEEGAEPLRQRMEQMQNLPGLAASFTEEDVKDAVLRAYYLTDYDEDDES